MEIAEKIAALFGEKPQIIIMRPEDWVGTEDVQEFLRVSENMRDSAKDAKMLIRALS